MRGALKLNVTTCSEVHAFTLRQAQHQFLDEGRDVLVRFDRTLPLLHAKDFFRHLNLQVLLYRSLTRKPPALGRLAPGKVRFFCRQHGTAALFYNALTLRAGAAATAGAGEKQIGVSEGLQQLAAGRHFDRALAIDFNADVATGNQSASRREDHQHQRQDDCGEHASAVYDSQVH